MRKLCEASKDYVKDYLEIHVVYLSLKQKKVTILSSTHTMIIIWNKK